jgi:hypothetical protein
MMQTIMPRLLASGGATTKTRRAAKAAITMITAS